MTRDPEALIQAWLVEVPADLPDRVVDSIAIEIHRTRQAGVGPWRFPLMPRTLVAAAVAVVAVAVSGAALISLIGLPSTTTGGPSIGPSLPASVASPASPSAHPVVSAVASASASSTPTASTGPSVTAGDGRLVAGTTYSTTGFGMRFTYVLPASRDEAIGTIANYNQMMIQWGAPPSRVGASPASGRVVFRDHGAYTTDPCQPADVGHAAFPATAVELEDWIHGLPGLRVTARPSLEVDGREVKVFDATVRTDCDPFTERYDPSPAEAPLHRLYIIPSNADTILAYSSIFDRVGVEAITDPLIASIHFVE